MTPQEHELIRSLVLLPRRGRKGSPEEILGHFGVRDGRQLGIELLRDALGRHDGTDVEMAFIVCATFGAKFTVDDLDLLKRLSSANWHRKHEDVVTALGKLRTPRAVDALYQATQWVPEYLAFDEHRALAVKAIWALGGTPGNEAERALNQLLDSDSEILRDTARTQLERRKVTQA